MTSQSPVDPGNPMIPRFLSPRFLTFVGRDYYPSVPPGDFLSSHSTLESAVAAGIAGKIADGDYGCWYVVCSFDGITLLEVAQG